LEFENAVHVLYRKSQVWDSVEGAFIEPLLATTKAPSEINAVLTTDEVSSSSSVGLNDAEKHGSLFVLGWTRTSTLSGGVFDGRNDEQVLGYLAVSVPFVLFRGRTLCAEVVAACSEQFINASID
jgi:hypothetical protein